jgi:DEAD/DEAH box helicase domain-containing protein
MAALMEKNLVYFDLETQRSAQEVGGWQNKKDMRMSIGVTYSTGRGSYRIYGEEEVEALLTELQRAHAVIGFNIRDFDFEVLKPYSIFDLSQVPVLDLIDGVETSLGRRVGLDAIATQTLGAGKTAKGTDALKWWKEGKMIEIAEYCCYDVKATKMVHEFGSEHGQVYYLNDRTQKREPIAVQWKL